MEGVLPASLGVCVEGEGGGGWRIGSILGHFFRGYVFVPGGKVTTSRLSSVGSVLLKGGGGVLQPKSPKVCVPKTAQINISFCKILFCPTMKSGSEGGGGGSPPHL